MKGLLRKRGGPFCLACVTGSRHPQASVRFSKVAVEREQVASGVLRERVCKAVAEVEGETKARLRRETGLGGCRRDKGEGSVEKATLHISEQVRLARLHENERFCEVHCAHPQVLVV